MAPRTRGSKTAPASEDAGPPPAPGEGATDWAKVEAAVESNECTTALILLGMQLQRDERDSDSARIEALLDEHQALFLCTVSKNGGGQGAQARLGLQKSSRYRHIEVDFRSSAEGIAEVVRALVGVGREWVLGLRDLRDLRGSHKKKNKNRSRNGGGLKIERPVA